MLCHLFKVTQLAGNGAGIQIYVYLLILKLHLNFLFYIGVVVLLLSRVQLFVTPWTAARQVSLSITNSRSLLKRTSIMLVMPSNHLILCCPLLLPPSIFSSISVFSNEMVLHIRWPEYWSFSFSISPSNECSGLGVKPSSRGSSQPRDQTHIMSSTY